GPTAYLESLADELPPEVDVMWTGPTVCSPVIRAADARAWASSLAGRRPLLWDNYPVNDGTMVRSLHLGPYRGRTADLTDELDGVLCNPMLQAYASQVPLATAAAYLCDPEEYDPDASWSRAIPVVGRSRAAGRSGSLSDGWRAHPRSSPEDPAREGVSNRRLPLRGDRRVAERQAGPPRPPRRRSGGRGRLGGRRRRPPRHRAGAVAGRRGH